MTRSSALVIGRLPAIFALSLWAIAGPGCGGDGAATRSAEAPNHAADGEEAETEADESGAANDEAEPEAPSGPSCDDGTCGMCAGSLCPIGWYCDEAAKACSWLRECPSKATCGCITRVLGASCKCSEEGGIAHVDCG